VLILRGAQERAPQDDGTQCERRPDLHARRANQRYQFARLTRQEGRLAIVTNVRWDAVDADVPTTNGTEADGEVVWS
jgi:hypothetical protein